MGFWGFMIWSEMRRRPGSGVKGILLLIAALFAAHYIAVAGAHLGFWADGRLVGHR